MNIYFTIRIWDHEPSGHENGNGYALKHMVLDNSIPDSTLRLYFEEYTERMSGKYIEFISDKTMECIIENPSGVDLTEIELNTAENNAKKKFFFKSKPEKPIITDCKGFTINSADKIIWKCHEYRSGSTKKSINTTKYGKTDDSNVCITTSNELFNITQYDKIDDSNVRITTSGPEGNSEKVISVKDKIAFVCDW